MNFKFLNSRNNPFEMVTEGGFRIIGKTHQLGIDYVDIECNGKVITVLKDKIDHIVWNK
ncbi:hypothetical protein ACOQFO_03965 [Ureibacillus sp. MALMAid1270]|uniref:hypothetical protein n=1 Tax=Ureibacillus sp. MALMAid1270 TaxID=3411629 RepID=UPI003BA45624